MFTIRETRGGAGGVGVFGVPSLCSQGEEKGGKVGINGDVGVEVKKKPLDIRYV